MTMKKSNPSPFLDENSSHASTSNHRASDSGDGSNAAPELAQRETRLVFYSKSLMIVALAVAACILAKGTYDVLSRVNTKAFESKFDDYASEIIQVSQIHAQSLFGAYEDFSRYVTSYAIGSNQTWPYVTLSGFEAMALRLTEVVFSRYVILTPFVKPQQRAQWELYAIQNHRQWINESFDFHNNPRPETSPYYISPAIFRLNFTAVPPVAYVDNVEPESVYAPIWQVAPIKEYIVGINYNSFDGPQFTESYKQLVKDRKVVTTKALDISGYIGDQDSWPQVVVNQPVFETLDESSPLVATITSFIPWHIFFENITPEGTSGIIMVVKNCDQTFSFNIQGPKLKYLGEGDFHDLKYDNLELNAFNTIWKTAENCPYTLHLYPSKEFRKEFDTNGPLFYSISVILAFFVTASSFLLYDCVARSSTNRVLSSAQKSNAIVDGFVPSSVRNRILEFDQQSYDMSLELSVTEDAIADTIKIGKPIADLHPHCTVMFADIVNFSTWSSVREPAQVIAFLEAVYSAFDDIAKRRGVFKVETIGDCYVAVAGLPKPRDDHAVVMAKFANACLIKLKGLVSHLEMFLGNGTSELGMRFGLHSGAVTAGVLRGDAMRFQLFGESVNMANTIQQTGNKNQIHISKATSDLLKEAGKGKWVVIRGDMVSFPGKGKLPTFWLQVISGASTRSFNTFDVENGDSGRNNFRLVNWNVEMLSRLLKQIVAMRNPAEDQPQNNARSSINHDGATLSTTAGFTVLDEVKEIIDLPNQAMQYKCDPTAINLGESVLSQLRTYVETIASMYHDNYFHSFQHACHVSQSLTKFLSRIVTTNTIDYDDMTYKRKAGLDTLHKYTYGITSDPIIQFACAFSALIHDVDHRGIPNTYLIKEESELARRYKNKSVAEQNSVDLAWNLLMQDNFAELRLAICSTEEELIRFRQLVVNSVMATDIVDKELGTLRKNRWNKAFNNNGDIGGTNNNNNNNNNNKNGTDSEIVESNRKATIVIEHLIQAADVAHTMQHWNVYLKWNECLFKEMYQAYLDGRIEKDPSIGWYEGEIGFFDFYIIPLAKKLESCGVFGVSSDECLNYAVANREEWKIKGKEIVADYICHFQTEKK